MSSVIFSKVAVLVLLAVAGGSTAGIGYYYQGRTTDLTSKVADLNNQNNSQHEQINSQKNQIDSLTTQVSNLTRQIDTLTHEIDQLQSTNSQLVSEIAKLRAELAANLCISGKTITIGELLDLSSALSDLGNQAKFSSAIAIDDVNSFLSSAGCNLKFAASVNDYALDNARALSQLQALAASGVQVVVGPLNSGAAQFLLSYANSNHIVMISPSSTSPALSIPNDYLFRTSPNDAAQGLADARMLVDRGSSAVIILERHDTYGDYLANAIATRFTALGGHIVATIPYDVTSQDYSATLTVLYNDFQSANVTYPNKVAIDAVSFEELGAILIQAKALHPTLLSGKLPWFGTDGEALDPVIIDNAFSAPLAAQVRLPSTLYASQNNSKTLAFLSRFTSAHPGISCSTYCLGAYDDVWLAALATLQAGSYDGTKIQAVMLTVASNYYGITGWTGLEPSGDRAAATYQVWKVVNQGYPAVPTWVLAGTWDSISDTITWVSPP